MATINLLDVPYFLLIAASDLRCSARLLDRRPHEGPRQPALHVLIDGENGFRLRAIALDHHLERLEAGERGLHGGGAHAFLERLLFEFRDEL